MTIHNALHKLSSLLALLFLTSCAQNVERTSYYLLDYNLTNDNQILNDPQLQIDKINLAPWLDQSSLVIAGSGSQVHLANNHLWTHSLEDALVQTLGKDLEKECSCTIIYNSAAYLNKEPPASLSVQVDKFNATQNGQVVFSGRYWLAQSHNDKAPPAIHSEKFAFITTLDGAGYDNAVITLRRLIQQLAQQIHTSWRPSKQ